MYNFITVRQTKGGTSKKIAHFERIESLPRKCVQNNLFPDVIARNRFRLITRTYASHILAFIFLAEKKKLRKDKFERDAATFDTHVIFYFNRAEFASSNHIADLSIINVVHAAMLSTRGGNNACFCDRRRDLRSI